MTDLDQVALLVPAQLLGKLLPLKAPEGRQVSTVPGGVFHYVGLVVSEVLEAPFKAAARLGDKGDPAHDVVVLQLHMHDFLGGLHRHVGPWVQADIGPSGGEVHGQW